MLLSSFPYAAAHGRRFVDFRLNTAERREQTSVAGIAVVR